MRDCCLIRFINKTIWILDGDTNLLSKSEPNWNLESWCSLRCFLQHLLFSCAGVIHLVIIIFISCRELLHAPRNRTVMITSGLCASHPQRGCFKGITNQPRLECSLEGWRDCELIVSFHFLLFDALVMLLFSVIILHGIRFFLFLDLFLFPSTLSEPLFHPALTCIRL